LRTTIFSCGCAQLSRSLRKNSDKSDKTKTLSQKQTPPLSTVGFIMYRREAEFSSPPPPARRAGAS
jgi:hypothetical protein